MKELSDSLKNRYQNDLESIKSSILYRIIKNQNCGGSYIDSSDWIKKQKNNNKSHQ